MFLHLNIKSCVHGENEDGQWIRLYMGRKFYQDPSDVEQIDMESFSGETLSQGWIYTQLKPGKHVVAFNTPEIPSMSSSMSSASISL